MEEFGSGFFRVAIESSTVAMVVLGADGAVRYHTAEAARLVRRAGAELNGVAFCRLFAPETVEAADAYVQRLRTAGGDRSVFFEGRCVLDDGDERWLEVTGVNLLDHTEVRGLVLSVGDRTELVRAATDAMTDALTGLANRRGLARRLASADRSVLVMVDVDNFKAVNDRHGHAAGDKLLITVARRLSQTFGPTASVYRLGGDEFLIVVPEAALDRAWQTAETALAAIEAPVGELGLRVTASIGITQLRSGEGENALVRADRALYTAKNAGRARIACPTDEEAGWEQRRRTNGSALANALRHETQLKSEIARLSEQIRIDDRTGLLNAQAYAQDIVAIDTVVRQDQSGYAMALCDIDYFGRYNSQYGYERANAVLREVADALKSACRPGDLVYRYGGEELLVILKDASLEDAPALAERLRRSVEELRLPHENRPGLNQVTISVGLSALDLHRHTDFQQVFDDANRHLRIAKDAGRNQVQPTSAKA